jgi:septum formation protein
MMNSHSNLILASTSRFRAQLLQRLQVTFQQQAPGVDEDAAKLKGLKPLPLSQTLARQKAEAVLAKHPGSLVIGGDQVCALADEVLGKPGTSDNAVQQLLKLQGRSHQLFTSISVLGCGLDGESIDDIYTNVASLHMKAMSRAQIERYVALDNPVDCCGAYMLENIGISLFEKIDCDDYTAIIGMPLMHISRILAQAGYQIP